MIYITENERLNSVS